VFSSLDVEVMWKSSVIRGAARHQDNAGCKGGGFDQRGAS